MDLICSVLWKRCGNLFLYNFTPNAEGSISKLPQPLADRARGIPVEMFEAGKHCAHGVELQPMLQCWRPLSAQLVGVQRFRLAITEREKSRVSRATRSQL